MSGFADLLNFRDFGGYQAGDRRVREGLMFRSAAPHAICDADVGQLRDHGITVVIDLRRWSERQAAPSQRWPGFAGRVVEAAEQDVMAAPHERYLAGDDISAPILRERVLTFYREAPFDPRHVDLFRRGFEAIADAEGGVHIHCAVGKDRTGILVSLIHHALGVSAEDQMREYLLTARERRLIDWLNERSVAAADELGKVLSVADAEILTGVDRAYLETAWAAMRERSGSIEGYLAEIGVSNAVLERMRARLLV